MFQNYLKIALRNLWRNKTYAFISIAGLALGMACTILLMLTVYHEFSFDAFHEKKASLYHIYTKAQRPDGEGIFQSTPLPLVPALKAEIPSIRAATRLASSAPTTLKMNNAPFREHPVFVDEDFVKMFSLTFLQGSPDAALRDLQSMIISKEIATKMFGENANAIGKQVTMLLDGEYKPFSVSGVIEELPQNSSLEASVIVRFEHHQRYASSKDNWSNMSPDTYILLKETATQQDFERSLQPFVDKHYAENIKGQKEAGMKPNERGHYIEMYAQPLSDWHFGTLVDKTGSAKTSLYSLIAISVLILLIASINFINLSVARSFTRSREVGIRKTVGAQRSQIIAQFLGEALVIVGIALAASLVLAEALLPLYNTLMRLKLTLILQDSVSVNVAFWGALVLVLLVVGIGAGAYPAFYLSHIQAVHTMKKRADGFTPSKLRNILVVVQFALAVGLIACTMIIREQTAFMQAKSLGFNRSGVVMIPTGDAANGNKIMERYKSRFAGNTDIINMSVATKPVGRGLDNSNSRSHIGRTYNGGEISVDAFSVYFNYIETMEIPLLAGRTFNREHITADTTESIITNELAARQIWNLIPKEERLKRAPNGEFTPSAIIGFSVPKDGDGDYPMTIIGVTKDYHSESLRLKIEPAIHLMWSGNENYIFVRIRLEKMAETMPLLERTWREVSPDVPWQGSFLDDNIARMYRNFTRMTNLTMTGAAIAIMLSCIGLFALAAMMIAARTKEIGIRKVLGASVASIIGLVSKDFLVLVAVAIVIATPVAWWLMRGWLEGFAYRVELSWWVFAGAGVLAVAIAFATVASQAWRAARSNPVDALRSE
jgi:putative ABC transport system permease protein